MTPLAGMTVCRFGGGLAGEVAAWLLAGQGAQVLEERPAAGPFRATAGPLGPEGPVGPVGRARADLVVAAGDFSAPKRFLGANSRPPGPDCAPRNQNRAEKTPGVAWLEPAGIDVPEAGLPEGTVAYLCGIALATAALAAWRGAAAVKVTEIDVAVQAFLPPVMAAAYGSPSWPVPRPPSAAPDGTSWLSADLGAPGDADNFEVLLSTLPPDADAATVAAAAQEWRLAVCPYSTRRPVAPELPVRTDPAAAPAARAGRAGPSPLADVSVCDLTAMWAGPLATWLLGRLGATVHKIEPAVRIDGMRALDGRGIYPGGRHTESGEDSALFNALNGDKGRVDLDLRDPADRERFLTLARESDVVIESFSPRVMPNFGLGPDVLGQGPSAPLLVSMPAFPPGALRNWVAYGTGVHALSGLGHVGPGRFSEPAVTYPDVVAGFTAAFAVVAALVGRDRDCSPGRLEVPLMDATRPLLAFPAAGSVAGRDPRAGGALFGAGRFVKATVAGAPVMHPVGPFGVGGAP